MVDEIPRFKTKVSVYDSPVLRIGKEQSYIRCYNRKVEYELHFEDKSRPMGQVAISFLTPSDIANEYMRARFDELGLDDNDVIARLDPFWPNGYDGGVKEALVPQMRKGVGSKIMKRAIKDASIRGANAIYCFTDSDSMKTFLGEKQGFDEIGKKKRGFIKKLEQPSITETYRAKIYDFFKTKQYWIGSKLGVI